MALSNLSGWNEKMEAASAAACGSACGASDKPEEKPAACGSACGAGDKPTETPAVQPIITLPAEVWKRNLQRVALLAALAASKLLHP